MTFQAGEGARRVLRLWIALAGVLASGLTGLLAGLLTPWLLLLTALVSVLTVFLFLWYPQRYAASLKGGFDGEAVRAQMGVLWRRQIFVPMQALRTFETWQTPIQRLFHCRTLILRFAGGAAILPLLPDPDALMLTRMLEECEEGDA